MKSFMLSILLTAIKGQYDYAKRLGVSVQDEYGQRYDVRVVHEAGHPVIAIQKRG